ncbi:MAG TPA: RusA family crossover junction endodeoxyribonuclease [Ruminococcaceae bacterium]|jgi:Holliday junction resolvase RusA-like endonuclease|nr:RusA family crossover junction endodeoxyribonuclease [Oscillospiraceae bacterium]
MNMINFTIPGPPQGKARPKVVRIKTGASVTYTPDKTVRYEELTRSRWQAAANGFKFADDAQIAVAITARYPIPKSKSKRVKAAMLAGSIKPAKKPDCDNIVKIICDALNGIAYRDDAQIVQVQMAKEYAGEPRTGVRLWEVKK